MKPGAGAPTASYSPPNDWSARPRTSNHASPTSPRPRNLLRDARRRVPPVSIARVRQSPTIPTENKDVQSSTATPRVAIRKPEGKLGVLTPGLGAVATTFIAGVECVRRGLSLPIGSLTQMATIRLGKRTEQRSPLIKDFAPLAPQIGRASCREREERQVGGEYRTT